MKIFRKTEFAGVRNITALQTYSPRRARPSDLDLRFSDLFRNPTSQPPIHPSINPSIPRASSTYYHLLAPIYESRIPNPEFRLRYSPLRTPRSAFSSQASSTHRQNRVSSRRHPQANQYHASKRQPLVPPHYRKNFMNPALHPYRLLRAPQELPRHTLGLQRRSQHSQQGKSLRHRLGRRARHPGAYQQSMRSLGRWYA